jgi:fructoselysine-6-P-deglycase FrlB-like protein
VTFVEEEIESQPSVWRAAGALAGDVGDLVPRVGERAVFVGCGTSLYVAHAVARLRERAGLGEGDAFPASELPLGRRYDSAVALSRSGTTTEVLDVARELSSRSVPVLAVTADASGPLGAIASQVVAMPFADERSVVQTRFATATLAFFRSAFGEDLEAVVADGGRALSGPLAVEPGSVRQLVFLGSGWSVGLAHEAALKVREAAQAWSEAYPAMEYRHGPISVAGPRTVVWPFEPLPEGLAEQICSTGAQLVSPIGDPMAELVRAQRVAVALADARGLDPDRPRHLTRSVVLEGEAHGS